MDKSFTIPKIILAFIQMLNGMWLFFFYCNAFNCIIDKWKWFELLLNANLVKKAFHIYILSTSKNVEVGMEIVEYCTKKKLLAIARNKRSNWTLFALFDTAKFKTTNLNYKHWKKIHLRIKLHIHNWTNNSGFHLV